jgi:hypothetical protein
MQMAGIDLLPPETGIAALRRELIANDRQGEVVIAGNLGLLVEELGENGGLDPEKATHWFSEQGLGLVKRSKVMAAKLYEGLEIETVLDPQAQPFLFDHRVNGTPLLPGVMGTELFAQLAAGVSPGYRVAAVSNEQFDNPFKFYRMEPQTLHWTITIRPMADGDLVAHGVLKSVRQLAREDLPIQEKVHFTADVYLTRRPLDQPTVSFEAPEIGEMPIAADEIYQTFFHGPAYQVLERVQVDSKGAIGLLPSSLPPDTEPPGASCLMAPRLIELCFQTAGVWQVKKNGAQSLPTAVGSVKVYRPLPDDQERRLYALVEVLEGGDGFNAQVVDDSGDIYLDLSDYRTTRLPELG